MELTKKVVLNINQELYTVIKAKQYDNARNLLFRIINNGVPFSLEGKQVKIYAIKSDGKKVFNDCNITNAELGEAKLKLTSQMLAVPGKLNLELIISEGKEVLSTIPFEIEVIKSLRSVKDILSENEFNALLSSINEGKRLEVSIYELTGLGKDLYNKLKPVVDNGRQLNVDLPPKITSAENIYNLLDAAIRSGQLDTFMKKTYLDTRDNNENPEWYFENYPNQTITELKLLSSMGVSGSNYFGILTTKVPWNNNSGGYPVQTFVSYSLMPIYKRHGTSNTEWSKWETVYTSGNKPTPDEIGAIKKPSITPLWDAGEGGWVFTEGHKATLTKNISDTSNGITLIWSAYTGGVIREYNYIPYHIPKIIGLYNKSIVIPLINTGGKAVYKTVYIRDNGAVIQGHSGNESGENASMVLRSIYEA